MPGAIAGRVGFFDLLGYRSFLANNEPEAAEKVLDVITDSRKRIPEQLLHDYPAIQNHELLLNSLCWLVISDTVLITSPQLPSIEENYRSWLEKRGRCHLCHHVRRGVHSTALTAPRADAR